MSAATQFERAMNMQMICLLGVGLTIIVVMCVVGLVTNMPYIFIVVLTLTSLLTIIISSINVSCMITGGCHLWSWIVTVGTIFALLMVYARAMRVVDMITKFRNMKTT